MKMSRKAGVEQNNWISWQIYQGLIKGQGAVTATAADGASYWDAGTCLTHTTQSFHYFQGQEPGRGDAATCSAFLETAAQEHPAERTESQLLSPTQGLRRPLPSLRFHLVTNTTKHNMQTPRPKQAKLYKAEEKQKNLHNVHTLASALGKRALSYPIGCESKNSPLLYLTKVAKCVPIIVHSKNF